MKIECITGGITAPKGFKASGIHCGIKQDTSLKDLGLIMSEVSCAAAGVFTKNKVKGAPILVSQKHLKNKRAKAIIVNSGNANTCNGQDGMAVAEKMAALTGKSLDIAADEVLVASTGVIGVPLDVSAIENGMEQLVSELSCKGSKDASQAIMTTDTVEKEVTRAYETSGKMVKIGGIAKGSGMIEPNMCTMLGFITTDVNIDEKLLDEALREAVNISFNRITIDGDTSTNDTVFVLANGESGIEKIIEKDNQYKEFVQALTEVCVELSKMLARDGEGATKLVTCTVKGSVSEEDAEALAKSVIKSSLVKTAMFGEDANWGRVLCALGYAEAEFDPEKVEVSFNSKGGSITICKNGAGIGFDEDEALLVLKEEEVTILVDLHQRDHEVTVWGCDLTYDYVKINGDYRT